MPTWPGLKWGGELTEAGINDAEEEAIGDLPHID